MAKILDYEFRDMPEEVVDFKDDVTILLNNGKYAAQVVATAPNWTANNGEFVFFRDDNTRRLYFYLNNAWDFIDTESPRITINFEGTATPSATINQSYNVSALTRVATGKYRIDFSENLTDANMIASGMARDLSSNVLSLSPVTGTLSSLEVHFFNSSGALRDPNPAMVVIHGD